MAGYLANMLGDANNLGFFATSEALIAAYPVGAPGYFAVVGTTNTLWVWDEITEAWVDSGAPGADAYVYIAYASDDSGSDFSTAFSPTLDYIAIKNTTTEIPTPQASDFTGLWKKYKGEKGDTGDSASVNTGTTTTGAPGTSASVTNIGTELNAIFNFTIPEGEKGDTGDTGNGIDNIAKTGTSGLTDTYTITFTDGMTTTFDVVNGEDGEDGVNAYLYIAYASDDSGTGFTTTFNSTLDYIAIKNTTVEIPTPQASDFAGLWKKYKGEKGDTGERGLNWTNEEYSGATTYNVDDALFYNGSSYRCILESTGHLPTDTTYWALIAQKGLDGAGAGDMLASVYDPKTIAGNAFDMDKMVEGTNNKLVSSAEKTSWNNKLDDITGQSIADLSDVDSIAGITDGKVLKWDTDKFVVADDDDTTYTASDFDIKNLTDSTNLRAAWNNKLDDITGESIADLSDVDAIAGITDGKVLKWDTDKFVVADDDNTTYTASDFDIKNLTDSTNLRATWSGKQDSLGFTPEDVDNKVTSFQGTPDNSHYPSEKLVKDSLNAKANANNVLALDNTAVFTPDADYEPATKKYVDDNAGGKSVYEGTSPDTYNNDWSLKVASYDSVNFSVSSQGATQRGIAFKPDGTKMYMMESSYRVAHQYSLSNAWDLSTASYDWVNFSVSSEDSSPLGIAFKSDGSKMYVAGTTNDKVYQYTLSTPWDLSTASYDSVDFSVSSEDSSPFGIAFKSDGSKMYVAGTTNDKVYQYTLSTPWDLSTASYDSVDFSVSSEDSSPFGIAFKSDGTKMYMMGGANDYVHQYTLSTPWDLSTASYDSVDFSVSSEDSSPFGIAFKSDGTKMYMMGGANKKVYQYSTTRVEADTEIDCDTYDEYYLSAVAGYLNISITGTPTTGKTLFVGLKDNGTTKGLNWSGVGEDYGSSLPTATTAGKQHIIGLKYLQSAWKAIAVAEQE